MAISDDIANNSIASLQIRDVCSRLSRLVKKGKVQCPFDGPLVA